MKFTTVFRASGDVGGTFLLCLGLGVVVGFGPMCGVPVVACVGLPLAAVGFALYALGVMTIGDWDAPPARQLAGAICNVVGLLVAFGALAGALGYSFEEILRLSRANDLSWKTGLATASVSFYGYAAVVGLYTVGFGLRRRLRPVVAPMVAVIAGLIVPAPVFALVAMSILHKLPLSA